MAEREQYTAGRKTFEVVLLAAIALAGVIVALRLFQESSSIPSAPNSADGEVAVFFNQPNVPASLIIDCLDGGPGLTDANACVLQLVVPAGVPKPTKWALVFGNGLTVPGSNVQSPQTPLVETLRLPAQGNFVDSDSTEFSGGELIDGTIGGTSGVGLLQTAFRSKISPIFDGKTPAIDGRAMVLQIDLPEPLFSTVNGITNGQTPEFGPADESAADAPDVSILGFQVHGQSGTWYSPGDPHYQIEVSTFGTLLGDSINASPLLADQSQLQWSGSQPFDASWYATDPAASESSKRSIFWAGLILGIAGSAVIAAAQSLTRPLSGTRKERRANRIARRQAEARASQEGQPFY